MIQDIQKDNIISSLKKHMQELCVNIGSRHVGSEGEVLAANYIEKEFKEIGYDVVREEYPTIGWQFNQFKLVNITRNEEVQAVPCFFSNSVDIIDNLLWISFDEINDLDKIDVKNRLCMIEYWSGPTSVMGRNSIAEKLDKLNAAAAIFISDGSNHTTTAASTKIQRSPFLDKLGTCAVTEEGALQLAKYKNDKYHLSIDAKKTAQKSVNIIAKSIGDSRKGVLGAHYDTAPLTQGAGDDASGVAMILEISRILKNMKFNISLDFVAFSAEEYVPYQLPPGSENYIERHKSEDIKWFMNFDDFGIHISRELIHVNGIDKLPHFSSRYPLFETNGNGDDRSFIVNNIPTIWYYDQSPFKLLHTKKDSIDIIDFDKMVDGIIDAINVFMQINGA